MNIKNLYVLGPEKLKYEVLKHFPKVNKVGIFLSGGMESTLLTLMSFKIYGRDNVSLFYTNNFFSTNRKEGNQNIKSNIEKSKKLLNVDITYVDIDYNAFVKDRQKSIVENVNFVKNKYNVDALLIGFTELFFELEVFKQPGLTKQDIISIANGDPIKYKKIIEEFHLKTDQYTKHLLDISIAFESYKIIKDRSIISVPFDSLNKSEVVDLYCQLGLTDYLFKTTSCVTKEIKESGRHCGVCFNCQQRYDAFRILGTIEDQTEYASDEIKKHRDRLEKLYEN